MIPRDAIVAIASRLRRFVHVGARLDRQPPYHDLDSLAGTWTADEADEFDRRLAEQRQVDEAAWE